MKAIDLYKYVIENGIEWHWQENDGCHDVLIFPAYHQLNDLTTLLPPWIYADSGIKCVMKHGYIAIWLEQIAAHFDIELEDVFPRE